MLRIQRLMNMISDILKKLWAVAQGLLVLISIQACTLGPVKEKPKNEIWLLDPEVCALYRVTGPGQEQVIPIQNNPGAAEKFMCIDSDEADEFIEEYVE